jgi:hypothetical protein
VLPIVVTDKVPLLPELVITRGRVFVEPTFTVPNARLVAESETIGATAMPVPDSWIVCKPLAVLSALSERTTLPLFTPAAVGSKLIETSQVEASPTDDAEEQRFESVAFAGKPDG